MSRFSRTMTALVVALAALGAFAPRAPSAEVNVAPPERPALRRPTRPATPPATPPATAAAEAGSPAPQAAPAAPVEPAPGGDELVAMNFKDAEIEAVVKFISELSGRNFILDDKVRGKVTVISPTKLTRDEAFEVFQAILNVKGFTIVPAGKVWKILPQQDARQTNIETVGEGADAGDRYVTQLIPLKHVDTDTAVRIIEPLRSKNSSLVAYPPTNTLILTDAYTNIERLVGIVNAIDVATVGVTMEILRLKQASADAVAATLTQAVTSQQLPRQRRIPTRATATAPGTPAAATAATPENTTKIIADTRTNSLIIITDADTMADIKTMIEALDAELPSGAGAINVLHLRYADAENVASVLNSISKSAPQKAKTPGQPAAVAAASPATQVKGAEAASVQFEEPVNITADKATNSLVIIAIPQDFQTLKQVIDRLDVRRPQVLIEALVMEMSYAKAIELGVEWRTTTDASQDDFNVVGGTNFGGMSSLASLATNPLAGPTGLFMAAIDGTVEVGGVTFPNVGALVRALQTRGDVNVLSTPHLLTTDNEEAEIIVSNNIPFQTSEKFDSNGNPIYTFEYRDVGLTLRFTPQINDDDFVKLKLFQEVSDVLVNSTGGATNAPSTTKRSVKSTVLMRDNATVVIGGLIQDNRKVIQSAVPCLGDIPFLGALFRSQENDNDKTNLMIFLTPHIVREVEQMEAITKKKRMEHEKFIEETERLFDRSLIDKLKESLDGKPEEDGAPAPAAEETK